MKKPQKYIARNIAQDESCWVEELFAYIFFLLWQQVKFSRISNQKSTLKFNWMVTYAAVPSIMQYRDVRYARDYISLAWGVQLVALFFLVHLHVPPHTMVALHGCCDIEKTTLTPAITQSQSRYSYHTLRPRGKKAHPCEHFVLLHIADILCR